MAKGRKPAIQANQGHPGGIVDDVLIPIAKKVIRKTAKTHKGALAKEVKMLAGRHNKLTAAKAAAIEYSAPKAARRASKKITKNMRSSRETATKYAVNPYTAGLPAPKPKPVTKYSNPKYADFLTERAFKKSKTGRIGGDELRSIGRRSSTVNSKKKGK